MKRIITYLIVLLLTLPVMGQKTQDRKQEHKGFNKQRTIKTIKKNIKDVKHPHYQVHAKRSEILKYTKADKYSLDSVIIQQWNENLNEGINYWKEEYTYDVNENVSVEIDYYWNGTLWVESDKYEFTFDSNKITQEINYEWNGAQWIEYLKSEYIYNTSQQLTIILYSDQIYNQWTEYGKIEYTYDGNGNMILETVFWTDNNINWYAFLKYEYSYDTNNNRTAIIAYDVDQFGQWAYDWKDEYTYDTSENLVTEIDSDRVNDQWVEYDKYEYFYDTNGNTITDIKYEWNTPNGPWIESEKYEYHHDLAYSTSDVIIPFWLYGNYDYVFYNLVTGFSFYNYIASAFVKTERTILFYSDYNNALSIDDELLAMSIKLYPNPVDDVLTIDSEIPLTNVEIFSVLGKKVKEMHSGFKSLPMDNLSTGVYIIRIRSENGVAHKKIVKK